MRDCLRRVLKEEARTWVAVAIVLLIYLGVKSWI